MRDAHLVPGVCRPLTEVGRIRIQNGCRTAVTQGYTPRRLKLIWWRQGRSRPYGEGVSFWALAEMVKAQAGILESDAPAEARAKLAAMTADLVGGTPGADQVRRHLGALAGLGDGVSVGGDRSEAWHRRQSSQCPVLPGGGGWASRWPVSGTVRGDHPELGWPGLVEERWGGCGGAGAAAEQGGGDGADGQGRHDQAGRPGEPR